MRDLYTESPYKPAATHRLGRSGVVQFDPISASHHHPTTCQQAPMLAVRSANKAPRFGVWPKPVRGLYTESPYKPAATHRLCRSGVVQFDPISASHHHPSTSLQLDSQLSSESSNVPIWGSNSTEVKWTKAGKSLSSEIRFGVPMQLRSSGLRLGRV